VSGIGLSLALLSAETTAPAIPSFAASTAWILLFVFASMPWKSVRATWLFQAFTTGSRPLTKVPAL